MNRYRRCLLLYASSCCSKRLSEIWARLGTKTRPATLCCLRLEACRRVQSQLSGFFVVFLLVSTDVALSGCGSVICYCSVLPAVQSDAVLRLSYVYKLKRKYGSVLLAIGAVSMLTYLPAELRALNHDRPPRRQVRKVLFTLRLWRPARWRRRHHCRTAAALPPCCPQTPPTHNVNTTPRRSADRSMLIGWLNVQSLTNKTFIVSDVITERSLDVFALTETWHTDSIDVRLRLATPDGYAVVDAARQHGRAAASRLSTENTSGVRACHCRP